MTLKKKITNLSPQADTLHVVCSPITELTFFLVKCEEASTRDFLNREMRGLWSVIKYRTTIGEVFKMCDGE